jgi:ring-1,2-phenylacetyl-CoA epoxidase subunit PaaC
MAATTAPLGYLLHLADNALVLGQRNAEWCAHGPVLEEDIAMANISLDLIGQDRLLYQHAAQVQGKGATEDSLAYFRDEKDFRSFTLLELPHHGPLAGTAAADTLQNSSA